MTEWEAIEKRISCRAYEDRPVEGEVLDQIADLLEELNTASGQRFRLIRSEEPGVPAIRMNAPMFSGPIYAFVALVGGDDPLSEEKVGYYGELLALELTRMGLGCCWVASTYDKNSFTLPLAPGQRLWDVMPLGYAPEKTPLRTRTIRAAIRRSDRKVEELVETDGAFAALPEWVRKAAQAVHLGPSAVNHQPINLVWRDGVLSARVWKENHGMEWNDLGIAKYQAEAAARSCGVTGRWDWGDGGRFTVSE